MFDRTREALKKWDTYCPKANDFLAAKTEEDIRLLEAKLEGLWLEVSEAFFEDTKPANQMSRCRLVHPNDPWLRKLIANHPADVPTDEQGVMS